MSDRVLDIQEEDIYVASAWWTAELGFRIIDQQKSELNSDELNDVSRMLVKFSILEGDLNKFIIECYK